MSIDRADLRADMERRFNYHAPRTPERVNAHDSLRTTLYTAALIVIDETPLSREQSLAITKLEEAMFWANAALARSPQE